jgi:CBS domain-containing protein
MAHTQHERLSSKDRQRVAKFLYLYGDIEKLLSRRLKRSLGDRTDVSNLIKIYLDRSPYWGAEAHALDHFRQIRNFLTHEESLEYGYPVVVTQRSVSRLAEIKEGLARQVPIGREHKKTVTHVTPSESLAQVVKLAYAHQYSQFPVLNDGQFLGLITENELTRWLGRHASIHGSVVDLEEVNVNSVLREKEPGRRNSSIFRFVGLDIPEIDVMGMFIREPALEVVLLTSTGRKDSAMKES